MSGVQIINGFSKLSREEKVSWLTSQVDLSESALKHIGEHLFPDPRIQQVYGDISENYLSNYFLPMGLAPNFLVNDQMKVVPMVIEESSVVAAASHAAKFWAGNGGFRTSVSDMIKKGQVHFTWTGSELLLKEIFLAGRRRLLESVHPLTSRMEKRGGGIQAMEIRPIELPGVFQLDVSFRTADAMGANFINSVLETLATTFRELVDEAGHAGQLEILMSILSNYTPECLVTCEVESGFDALESLGRGISGRRFAEKFKKAVDVARVDIYRAVTHNKGIFNGMDAVILATGNDFRAAEACGQAYAARDGSYRSLSRVELSEKRFRFVLEVPLALGTTGGLTRTHPLASAALEILGNPSAAELMQIVASAGLANNFSAIRSLITTGIQEGHMKMHLGNLLRQLDASESESLAARDYFSERKVSYAGVQNFLDRHRQQPSGDG